MAQSLPPILTQTLTTTSHIYHTLISPFLPTPVDTLIRQTSTFTTSMLLPVVLSGDLTSIASLLVILYVSFRTLDYLRRSIFGWVLFVGKLVLLAAMVQGFVYAKSVGWEKAVGDAQWVLGMGWGVVEGWWDGADAGGNRNTGGSGGWGGNNSGRQGQWGAGGRNRWT